MTTEQRIALAEEATRLEAAGADWESKHVAAVLGCGRSTIYDTRWLMQCSRRVGVKRHWIPRELRAAQLLESARRDAHPMFLVSSRRTARRKTA